MSELEDKILNMEQEAPTLTFEPFADEEKNEIVETESQDIVQQEEEKPLFDESNLTEEECAMVDQFAEKINLSDSNLILQYGAGAQKKIADFSETTLNSVKSKDLGEIGDMLSNMVTELKSFDEEETKGFLGIFKKGSNKLTAMKAKYDKAETNVEKISSALESHQVQLMKDVAVLDKMYELNKNYFKELSMYILAGKKKLNEVETKEIPELKRKAQESGLQEDAQALNDLVALANRFDKKLHDLELTRTVSLQMAPQIRMIQNNDTIMAEKIQSTIVNTIPLWKSQMILALGVTHSGEAAKAQREVTDMTNALLKKNAETLKMATIETAKESERGIVDMETLKHTNESLISTLDEVMRIQNEGKAKRREAEKELGKIEQDLKEKLLQLHG
ncbi:MAG: toxic anion resistance protein [Lachnospiraceae bacterium]|nr:toxic anion resistance protein [Lachnospiraceae bacterium]MCI5586520.1 toxic anion resistance protein [Lachnospiraceae bacterium]